MYPQQRSRPDKHTDRLAWEASWAKDLSDFYDRPLRNLPRPTVGSFSPQSLALLALPDNPLHCQQKCREICSLQSDLARAVIPACVGEDFERNWKKMAEQQRREVVLEGLYRASCVAWLEERRGLCPEFTLRSLSAWNGTEYLRLLREILPSMPLSETARITSPIFIPHPKIDYIWALSMGDLHDGFPGWKAWVNKSLLDRTYFASMALWNIFLAFHGHSEEYAVARGPRETPEHRTQLIKVLNETYGKNAYKELKAELHRLQPEQHKVCWHCGTPEMSLEPGKRLRACGGCLTVNRKITYCSRECQVENWKNGVPIPHRVICGKALEAGSEPQPQARGSTSNPDARIPEPEPSFRRSPHLLHQISFLSQPPYVDYTFIFPHPLPDQGVTVCPIFDRIGFLTLRNEALCNGDPESVQLMYYILIPFAENWRMSGYTRTSLKHQLEREYEITLQELPDELDAPPSNPPSMLELHQAEEDSSDLVHQPHQRIDEQQTGDHVQAEDSKGLRRGEYAEENAVFPATPRDSETPVEDTYGSTLVAILGAFFFILPFGFLFLLLLVVATSFFLLSSVVFLVLLFFGYVRIPHTLLELVHSWFWHEVNIYMFEYVQQWLLNLSFQVTG
ncbi:hypothetical protein BC835DRAFT_1324575 [Cytidiella melzeri]|nr:hypothetical protein BC835DRAFT_1324575 [Cytidiella melzeri]